MVAMSNWDLARRCAIAVEPRLQPPPNWPGGEAWDKCGAALALRWDRVGLEFSIGDSNVPIALGVAGLPPGLRSSQRTPPAHWIGGIQVKRNLVVIGW